MFGFYAQETADFVFVACWIVCTQNQTSLAQECLVYHCVLCLSFFQCVFIMSCFWFFLLVLYFIFHGILQFNFPIIHSKHFYKYSVKHQINFCLAIVWIKTPFLYLAQIESKVLVDHHFSCLIFNPSYSFLFCFVFYNLIQTMKTIKNVQNLQTTFFYFIFYVYI